MAMLKKFILPFSVFIFTFLILLFVQLKVENPVILLERFMDGGGWVEIVFVSFYAAFISYKMKDPASVAIWRQRIWLLFSVVFFSQLILGLIGFEKFLMTGKLHLPIPAMILAGPVYRLEISFMPVLFLSTIILSGPAWCSQLCYFGALDGMFATGKSKQGTMKHKVQFKITFLVLFILSVVLLRMLHISVMIAVILGIAFGLAGLLVMVFLSRRNGNMIHCIYYCPVGTLVNYFRFINPFRMYIESDCTACMRCTSHCKYDALNLKDIRNLKPGITCTLCGDCLTSCHSGSIKYKLFSLRPEKARYAYIGITVTLHAVFLALARI